MLILFVFFSRTHFANQIHRMKREREKKICFFNALIFFSLNKSNHSAACVCWCTWCSAKHLNSHKLSRSYLAPLRQSVALLWEGGAATVHVCRRSLRCTRDEKTLLRSEKSACAAIWSCFEGVCVRVCVWTGANLKCRMSLWPQWCVWCVSDDIQSWEKTLNTV